MSYAMMDGDARRLRIPCTIMRGGTSKGVFLRAADLPQAGPARDDVLLRIFGSPDRRQIDGLGGAHSATSKAAIIAPPSRPDADLDYTYGQIGIAERWVDYSGICGNIAAAVAAYAVAEGYAPAIEPAATVRIHQTNTGRIIRAEVPVAAGAVVEAGDFAIDGVPGSGARIGLDFADAVGSVSGRLFPTGAVRDRVSLPGVGDIAITVVDVANIMIFVPADALGIGPEEDALALDGRQEVIERFEALRTLVAAMIGLERVSSTFPLAAAIAPPAAYRSFADGETVPAQRMDLWSRELAHRLIHKAYSGTGSVCAAVAALIPGTVVNAVTRASASRHIRIGHPSGIIETEAAVAPATPPVVRRAVVGRTARRIMDGVVCLRG